MADTKSEKKKKGHSLNTKTFIITLALTLVIGVLVLIAGFALYVIGVTHEYMVNTCNQANAEAAVVGHTAYKEIGDEVIRIFDSIPEEERGDGDSDEYIARFAHLEDEKFLEVREAMRSLQNREGPMNAFIVALDAETDRMIYIVDADPDPDTTCRPGTFDLYDHNEVDTLINGREISIVEKRAGIERKLHAVLTNREEYGLRCTAGSVLYENGKYVVMMCVDEKLNSVVSITRIFLVQFIIVLVIITILAAFIGMRRMRKAAVIPINKMAKAATAYGSEKERKIGDRHFDNLHIETGDELQQLAEALSGMEEDIEAYMTDLTHVTAEKERIETELSLAAKIQKSMLIEDFPVFPDRNEFDIYATMEPAKEVGGDFYDMILVDDDHLAIEIADVSGKGVPAALFMMASKIMILEKVKSGLTPAEVLRQVNDNISENNEQEMFVTVWLGILEISTGKLTAANAGHEYPIVIRKDGTAELIHDKHGFVIGGMSGMSYTDYDIMLEHGDSIFVYTDGVTEATNANNELFGLDRTLLAAGSCGKNPQPVEVLKTVRGKIGDFVEDAEQFDDLTMLCMKYR